jgi:hypothetical protein
MIADLTVGEATTTRAQPHTELRFRVHAPTLGALDRREFYHAITGVSRAAGTTTGRFLDLFDTDDRERIFSTYTGLPTVSENALSVEHRTCGDNVMPLDDLAVSADGSGYTWSRNPGGDRWNR